MKPDVAQYMSNPAMRAQIEKAQAGQGRGEVKHRAEHKCGLMNSTELRYVREVLEPRRLAGEITNWKFEGVKFRIGVKCFYTPDFYVPGTDGVIEIIEIKGHWEDDARVKIRAVVEMYPEFKFVAAMREGGFWVHEYFIGAVQGEG